MRRLSLLIGALGGALGGYILSNDKLREELMKAKDPEKAAKTLAKHLQADGKKVAKEVQGFVKSQDVQENLKKAKSFAVQKFEEAKEGVQQMMKKNGKAAPKSAGKKGGRKGFEEKNV